MPISNFEWVGEEEFNSLNWLEMGDDQEYGYIVEVDLVYPKNLHNSHNSFPLAPEQLTITETILSPYAKSESNLM